MTNRSGKCRNCDDSGWIVEDRGEKIITLPCTCPRGARVRAVLDEVGD